MPIYVIWFNNSAQITNNQQIKDSTKIIKNSL